MIFGLDFWDLFLIGSLIFLGVLLFLLLLATIARIYVKWTCPTFNSDVNLDGKTIIITGSNSGIGKETAMYMAKKGARVIMACRSMSTAKTAQDEIMTKCPQSKVILQHVDLSSFQSIRLFCQRIIDTEPKIDILIHNAGFASSLGRAISTDGLDYTMAANHYGPFLMNILLMDLLKKSAPCRIINVGSKAHTLSFLDPEESYSINPVGHWWPLSCYANSKMATLLTSAELARRIADSGVTINTLHPGAIDTGIYRNYPFMLGIFFKIHALFCKTLEEGIQTTLYVSLSTSLNNVSGEYFRDCKLGTPHKNVQKMDWQKKMFEESVKIVGITKTDPFV